MQTRPGGSKIPNGVLRIRRTSLPNFLSRVSASPTEREADIAEKDKKRIPRLRRTRSAGDGEVVDPPSWGARVLVRPAAPAEHDG